MEGITFRPPRDPLVLPGAIEHHVDSLRPDEVGHYLRHRIEVAGGKFEQVFEPGIEPLFHRASGGCPRLISLLADRSLLAAFSRQQTPVPRGIVESAPATHSTGAVMAPQIARVSPRW